MSDRGQTLNDYLLGISLLLISVLLVFGYFPEIFAPFEEEVSNEEDAMANNLATQIVENSTVSGSAQRVNFTQLNKTIDSFVDDSERAGIPLWLNWNVTVVDEQEETIQHQGRALQNGSLWFDYDAGTSIRFVQAQTNPACQDGCRIIVRVW